MDRQRPAPEVPQLDNGDFLLIEDNDLTQADAELLIESGARVVINAQLSVTGRVRSRGPQALLDAGIVLIDDIMDLFEIGRGP